MTSDDIHKLLRLKHSEDIYVAECKDGPSGSFFAMMDAWVMPKSWAHPEVTVYEIKVTRSDFVRDNKWHKYLGCCNLFYFVAPDGIIDPKELPPEAGLLEVSKTGGRLFTRKKAQLRQVTIPESLFRYVLMNRCTIGAERESYKPASWEEQMQKKAEDRRYGHMLGKRIAALYKADVLSVQVKNEELEQRMKRYEEHIEFLKKLGFDPKNSWINGHELQRKIREMTEGHTTELFSSMERMERQMEHFRLDLREVLKKQKPAPDSAG